MLIIIIIIRLQHLPAAPNRYSNDDSWGTSDSQLLHNKWLQYNNYWYTYCIQQHVQKHRFHLIFNAPTGTDKVKVMFENHSYFFKSNSINTMYSTCLTISIQHKHRIGSVTDIKGTVQCAKCLTQWAATSSSINNVEWWGHFRALNVGPELGPATTMWNYRSQLQCTCFATQNQTCKKQFPF